MKENKQKQNDSLYDEELDIFGEHKTREQVRAEEKVRRKEEREALKQELKRRRQEVKEGNIPSRRKDIIVVSAVLAGIVLLCVLALFTNFSKEEKSKEWAINEDRGHFVDEKAQPVMSGDQPEAAVTEAYFTNNGHLCIEMSISNGTNKVLSIDAMDVSAYNYLTGECIGGGKAELEEPLTILLAGVESYTFYIAPEHIQIGEKESVPELMSFDITMDYHAVEEE